jgi:hypothetical protein
VPEWNSRPPGARWRPRNLWSDHFDLVRGDTVIASVDVNGSRGAAQIGNRQFILGRLRLPAYVTIRDAGTHDLVARLCLFPKRGFCAEFADGESFRLGWVAWWKREWSWTDECGEPVVWSRRSWLGTPLELFLPVSGSTTDKWRLLAVLELAAAKLAVPWF